MKKKTAWLIAWEASTDRRLSHIRGPRILAFFDGRKSCATVREIVFGIYLSSNTLNHEEKFSYGLANEGKKIIRQDEVSCIKFGLNPWVVARLVEDLELHKLDDGVYVIRWKQRVFSFPKGGEGNPTSELVCKEEKVCRT